MDWVVLFYVMEFGGLIYISCKDWNGYHGED